MLRQRRSQLQSQPRISTSMSNFNFQSKFNLRFDFNSQHNFAFGFGFGLNWDLEFASSSNIISHIMGNAGGNLCFSRGRYEIFFSSSVSRKLRPGGLGPCANGSRWSESFPLGTVSCNEDRTRVEVPCAFRGMHVHQWGKLSEGVSARMDRTFDPSPPG